MDHTRSPRTWLASPWKSSVISNRTCKAIRCRRRQASKNAKRLAGRDHGPDPNSEFHVQLRAEGQPDLRVSAALRLLKPTVLSRDIDPPTRSSPGSGSPPAPSSPQRRACKPTNGIRVYALPAPTATLRDGPWK